MRRPMNALDQLLSNVVFVLDRPKDALNVGAVVRLMGNFGLPRLRLVEPAVLDPDQIMRLARRGRAVLEATELYPSLPSALSDCGFVLGTTRRTRTIARPVLSPREVAPTVLASSAVRPAAIVFGPEDFGLDNAALDRCHALLTIPAVPDDASLNLAQAALLVAYELRLAALERSKQEEIAGPAAPPPASGAEMESLFDSLRLTLEVLHPIQISGRTENTISRLRALFMRAAPTSAEAALLTSIFGHIAHGFPAPPPDPPR
jgi:TrmH family RNA methyltransferase